VSSYKIEGVIPVVHPSAFVHETASLIGDVHIGAGCYIGPFASLRGDFGRIVVGEGSNIQDSCVLHVFPGKETRLEPNSHIGHAAVLHGCHIESFVLVGIGSTVLDGAVVGEGSLIGAGSLLTSGMVVPPKSLVLGSPAQVVSELDDEALRWKENGVRVYQDLARRSKATMTKVEPLAEVETNRPELQIGPAEASRFPSARNRSQSDS